MRTPKIHELPAASRQEIQGQRTRTANREAAHQPRILEARPPQDPTTLQARPPEPHVKEPHKFTPAFAQNVTWQD